MSKSNLKLRTTGITLSVIILTSLTACALLPATPVSVTQTSVSITQTTYLIDYITAKSMPELVNKSTIVVIGTAIRLGNIINMWRQEDDYSKPSPDHFGTGQVYEIEVTQYLKGAQETGGSTTIYLVQAEGNITNPSQMPPTAEEIQQQREAEKVIPVKLGVSYIFFIRPIEGMADLTLHFTGTMQPWRFTLMNGCAYAESPWNYVNLYFRPQPVEDLIKQIENPQPEAAQTATPWTYPAQSDEGSTKCKIETIQPTIQPIPYPYP